MDRSVKTIPEIVYPAVLTKTNFVARYNTGEFGNRSPTWDSYSDWRQNHEPCAYREPMFHLRNRVIGGPTIYNVTPMMMGTMMRCMFSKGVANENIYISEMCPTEGTTIQGEVMRSPQGLYLFYSTIKKPMRDALRERGQEATGLKAKMLLQHHLNQRSYDWLELLLDRYEDHVIEFTALSESWGTVPGFNTLFWEVRKY